MRDIWITQEGVKIPIKDMSTGHLINAINMLERNKETIRSKVAMRYSYFTSEYEETVTLEHLYFLVELHEMSADEILEQFTPISSMREELNSRKVSAGLWKGL